MSIANNLTALADYQDWLNTIKQRVQSARLPAALTEEPCQTPFIHEEFWQRPVARIGQQRVDQFPWVRRYVTGFAS